MFIMVLGERMERKGHESDLERHLGLVVHFASKWAKKYGVKTEELLGAATEGLMRAMETYDPKRGAFSTYAVPWIEAFIRKELERNRKERELSLETPLDEEEEFTLESILPSPSVTHELAERAILRQAIAGEVERLPKEERIVAKLLGGFGGTPMDLDEIEVFMGREVKGEVAKLRRKFARFEEW